jgi:hypothetical protein
VVELAVVLEAVAVVVEAVVVLDAVVLVSDVVVGVVGVDVEDARQREVITPPSPATATNRPLPNVTLVQLLAAAAV